jgi:hypothetical protein
MWGAPKQQSAPFSESLKAARGSFWSKAPEDDPKTGRQ